MSLARVAESLHMSAADAVANSFSHVYQTPPECTRTPRPVLDLAAPGGVPSTRSSSTSVREQPGSNNTPPPGRAQLTPLGSTPAPYPAPVMTKKNTIKKKNIKNIK